MGARGHCTAWRAVPKRVLAGCRRGRLGVRKKIQGEQGPSDEQLRAAQAAGSEDVHTVKRVARRPTTLKAGSYPFGMQLDAAGKKRAPRLVSSSASESGKQCIDDLGQDDPGSKYVANPRNAHAHAHISYILLWDVLFLEPRIAFSAKSSIASAGFGVCGEAK